MLKLIVLTVCIFAVTIFAAPALDESSAKKFIIESSDKFSELYNEMAETVFDLSDLAIKDSDESKSKDEKVKDVEKNEISDSSDDLTSDEITGFFAFFLILAQIGKLQEATENITTLADEVYKFPIDQFKEDEVKIGLWKLKTMPGLLALGDEYHTWALDDFDDFLNEKNYCKLNEKNKCKAKYTELYKILKQTSDPEEALYYWKEYRERNLPEVSKKLKAFITLFENLGKKFKTTAKYAWFSDYLDENFGNDMEKVIQDLQPLYKELHGYVRLTLKRQYGDKIPENGLIPHHLFEQAVAQAWKPESAVAHEYKNVKMPIENNFKKSAKEIMETGSSFMESLGLSKLPSDFWEKRVKEDEDKSDDCNTEVFDSGNTTYLKYCSEVNVKRFLQMHGYVARIYYANERKHLPFAYSDPYNLELATGEAVILSASTPKYLHEIGHKDVGVLSEDEDINRLLRMGVHTLLTVPEYFVNVKVVADVLDGTVPLAEMNKHYWELMKKYLGVAPPVERTADSIDFPPKFYYQIENNHQSTKFVSEVIGYQIYEALCSKSGEFVKGDKGHSLHNCNFHNNKEAGKDLQSMMQLGSKKPMKQILGTVTGDDTGMKADAMIEYFAPLKEWLHEKNTKNNVKVGW